MFRGFLYPITVLGCAYVLAVFNKDKNQPPLDALSLLGRNLEVGLRPFLLFICGGILRAAAIVGQHS